MTWEVEEATLGPDWPGDQLDVLIVIATSLILILMILTTIIGTFLLPSHPNFDCTFLYFHTLFIKLTYLSQQIELDKVDPTYLQDRPLECNFYLMNQQIKPIVHWEILQGRHFQRKKVYFSNARVYIQVACIVYPPGNVFVMAAILLDRHLQSVANYLILRSYLDFI